jgi:hypothetical protein
MNTRSILRRALCVAAALLLLALSWWTIAGGVRNLSHTRSIGQWGETAIQLACGLLGIAVVVTRFWWQGLARKVRMAWTVSLAVFVGLSALVWGPPQFHIAALFVAVALLMAWGLLSALGRVPAAGGAPRATGPAASGAAVSAGTH